MPTITILYLLDSANSNNILPSSHKNGYAGSEVHLASNPVFNNNQKQMPREEHWNRGNIGILPLSTVPAFNNLKVWHFTDRLLEAVLKYLALQEINSYAIKSSILILNPGELLASKYPVAKHVFFLKWCSNPQLLRFEVWCSTHAATQADPLFWLQTILRFFLHSPRQNLFCSTITSSLQ